MQIDYEDIVGDKIVVNMTSSELPKRRGVARQARGELEQPVSGVRRNTDGQSYPRNNQAVER